MTRRTGALAVRLVVVAAVFGGVLTSVAAPSMAVEVPAVSISPGSVDAGGTVTVTPTGFPPPFPTNFSAVVICDASSKPQTVTQLTGGCGYLSPLVETAPAEVQVIVDDTFVTVDKSRTVRCDTAPEACAIGYFESSATSLELGAFAWTPVTVRSSIHVVTANPTSVADGGTVHLTLSGFPPGPGGIAQCDATQPDSTTMERLAVRCRVLQRFPGGLPSQSDLTASWRIVPDAPRIIPHDCTTANRCAAVAFVEGADGAVAAYGKAAITVAAPTLQALPDRNLVDNQTVHLSGTGLPAGPAAVRQCRYDNDDRVDWCGAVSTPVTVGADGTVTADAVVHAAVLDAAGVSHTCGYDCRLVVAPADGTAPVPAWAAFGAPRIDAGGGQVFDDGDVAWIPLQGFPGSAAQVAECAAPLGAEVTSSQCAAPTRATLDGAGNGSVDVTARSTFTTVAGSTVDCRVASCVVAGFDAGGATVASAPLALRAAISLSLAPAAGLADGQVVAFSVRGLSPGAAVAVVVCSPGPGAPDDRCGRVWTVGTADSQGRLDGSGVVNRQVDDAHGVTHDCSSGCSVAVLGRGAQLLAEQAFTLAPTTTVVTPSAMLSPGQLVRVNGTGLPMRTAGAAGHNLPRSWRVVECDRSIGRRPSLLAVHARCVVPRGGQGASVTGPRTSRLVRVQSSIRRRVGAPIRCSSSPGRCVVGLIAVENGRVVSGGFAPLTFR